MGSVAAATWAAPGTGPRSGPTTRRSPTRTGSTRATRCASSPRARRCPRAWRRAAGAHGDGGRGRGGSRPPPRCSPAARTLVTVEREDRLRAQGVAHGDDAGLRHLERAGRGGHASRAPSPSAEMLSFPDVVYVRFKRKADAKVGDKYVVFHTAESVKAPRHGQAGGLPHRVRRARCAWWRWVTTTSRRR